MNKAGQITEWMFTKKDLRRWEIRKMACLIR